MQYVLLAATLIIGYIRYINKSNNDLFIFNRYAALWSAALDGKQKHKIQVHF